jgi:hypothetical protein
LQDKKDEPEEDLVSMIARVASSKYEVIQGVKPFVIRERAAKRRKIDLAPIKGQIKEAGE